MQLIFATCAREERGTMRAILTLVDPLEMIDVSALIESDGPLFTAYGHAGVLLARSQFDGAQRLELGAQILGYNGPKSKLTHNQEERRILTSFNAGWFVADGTFTVEAVAIGSIRNRCATRAGPLYKGRKVA